MDEADLPLTGDDLDAFLQWRAQARRQGIKATYAENGPDNGEGRIRVWPPFWHIIPEPHGWADGAPRWTISRTSRGVAVVLDDYVGAGCETPNPVPTMRQALAIVDALIQAHTRELIDAIPVLEPVDF